MPSVEAPRARALAAQVPEPAQAGGGQHHGIHLAAARPARSGCPRCPGSAPPPGRCPTARPSRAAASRAAGEPVPIRTPSPRSASRRPISTSRVSSRVGHGGDLEVDLGTGRQVLQRVHGDVDRAGPQGVADGADEHPGAADLGEVAAVDVAAGGDADERPRHAAGGAERPRPARPGPGPAATYARPGGAGVTALTTGGPPGTARRRRPAGRGRTAPAARRRSPGPRGRLDSSWTRTVGACSSLSTIRRTVRCTSSRSWSSRLGSRDSSRRSSAATTSEAMVRSATTVGATWAARRRPRKSLTSGLDQRPGGLDLGDARPRRAARRPAGRG